MGQEEKLIEDSKRRYCEWCKVYGIFLHVLTQERQVLRYCGCPVCNDILVVYDLSKGYFKHE